jgi:CDP-diacylglycerol--glycerol-3-phosphate 3-phosphatidyltransferase
MKTPNILTLSRLCLAPVFLAAFLSEGPTGKWWALALALFFEATDLLDGFLARQLHQTSSFGKIIDPLADSVSRFTVFLAFLVEGYASVWAIACIFWRDSIISTVRILAASQGVIVSARLSGKVKAIIQGVAINVILGFICLHERLGKSMDEVKDHSNKLMMFVAVVTVLSLVDYLVGIRKILAKLDA